MRAFGTLLQAILGLALIALAWTATAAFMQDSRVPMPGPIVDRIRELVVSDDYLEHVRASMTIMTGGLLPGLAAGVVFGLLAGRSQLMRWIFGPLIVTLAAAPLIALMPLLVLWMGLRVELNIVVVFIMTAFPVMNAVMTMLKAQAGSAPKRMSVAVVHGLRWGVMLGVTALVISEKLASRSGVGTFIMNAAAKLDAVSIAAGIVMIVVPTVVIVAILQAIEEQIAAVAPERRADDF